MPFKSQAQRRWMYATHPKMAQKWAAHTPKGKKLPQHVSEDSPEGGLPGDDAETDEYTSGSPSTELPKMYEVFMFSEAVALKFKEGDRVTLLPPEDYPDDPVVNGVVVSPYEENGTYVVLVDDEYREPGDDGLREVPTEFIRPEKGPARP